MPNRRKFLMTTGAGIGAAALTAAAKGLQSRTTDKPVNVLFIMLDDVGREGLSFYPQHATKELPSGALDTPNMMALAEDGATRIFDNMRSNPICWGTRFEAMTGHKLFQLDGQMHRYTDNLSDAVHKDFDRTPDDLLYHHLEGYRRGAFGKWHLSLPDKGAPKHLQAAGLDEWGITFISDYFKDPSRIYDASEWTSHLTPGEATVLPSGSLSDDVASKAAIDFMQPTAEPWYCQLWLNLVHPPVIDLEERTPHSGEGGNLQGMVHYVDTFVEQALDHFRDPNPGKVDKLYGMVNYADRLIGQVLDHLRATNQFDETLIIIGSDNGGNGFVSGEKGNVSERGVGVPFMVRLPGTIAGGREGRLAQMTDLYPTILETAGLSTQRQYARSLYPLFQDGTEPIHDFVTQSIFVGNWMVADMRWKLRTPSQCRTKGHASSCQNPELFDLSNDPYEQKPVKGTEGGSEARHARSRLLGIVQELGLEVDMVAEAAAPWSTIQGGVSGR